MSEYTIPRLAEMSERGQAITSWYFAEGHRTGFAAGYDQGRADEAGGARGVAAVGGRGHPRRRSRGFVRGSVRAAW